MMKRSAALLRPHAGIPGAQYADVDKALDERTIGHNPERLSLLQGGIVYSNQVDSAQPRGNLNVFKYVCSPPGWTSRPASSWGV